MQRRWMRIIESGDDRDIGTALVRLAQRAAEMHRAELAATTTEEAGDAAARPDRPADDPHLMTRESER